eukprot:scaffold1782_cov414-Prasinococcus_capsulatus_cf.AAC.15
MGEARWRCEELARRQSRNCFVRCRPGNHVGRRRTSVRRCLGEAQRPCVHGESHQGDPSPNPPC